jgi:hypothetical protein
MTTNGEPLERTGDDRCYDKCGACGHRHYGRRSNYRCPRCSCNSRETRQ